jgi:hypothetical protein
VRLRCVLEQEELVPVGQPPKRVEIDGLPVEVHRHDRGSPRRDRRLDRTRVEQARLRIDVDENRTGSGEQDRLDSGDEGERRRDHLVARPDPGCAEDELDRRRAVRGADAVADVAVRRERLLELGDLRALDEPSVREHPGDRSLELLADRGVLGVEVEQRQRHRRPAGRAAR